MRYKVRTITAPGSVPLVVSLDAMKVHLEEDRPDHDDDIASKIRAAQTRIEGITGEVLTERELELSLSGFPLRDGGAIEIPRAPVTAISSVAYTDGDGAAQTLDGSAWRWSESEPCLLLPAYGTSWPSAYDERGSVRVRFMAGYDEGLAPSDLVAAVKMLTAHLYMNRESVVTGTIATELPHGVKFFLSGYSNGLG